MAFSKRLGLVPEKEIQINNMDSALKNKLYMLISCSAFVNYLTAKYEQIQK
jgi:hypothetical protein